MPPPLTAATSLHPSADDATANQYRPGALLETQVVPKLVEVKMPSAFAVISFMPSAEQAMDSPANPVAYVHVAPESVEIQVPPPVLAILSPSAEDASLHGLIGDGIYSHVAPELVEIEIVPN
jgi:hypothetical protein